MLPSSRWRRPRAASLTVAAGTWAATCSRARSSHTSRRSRRQARARLAAGRAPPEAARRAAVRRALRPPARGLGRGRARRAPDHHDRHRVREDARVQPARARRDRPRAEDPGDLPLPDEGAGAGPGAGARRAESAERPRRDLRRRHADRAPLADPQVGERHPDEPGHAPRRRAPAPRPLGRRAPQPPVRRRRRSARVPRRLRLACRQRPAAAAAARPRLRRRSAVPARLGDDREPGRARASLPGVDATSSATTPRRGRSARSCSGTPSCSTRSSACVRARSARRRGCWPGSCRVACGRSASPRAARAPS